MTDTRLTKKQAIEATSGIAALIGTRWRDNIIDALDKAGAFKPESLAEGWYMCRDGDGLIYPALYKDGKWCSNDRKDGVYYNQNYAPVARLREELL